MHRSTSPTPIRICYVIGSLARCGTAVHLLAVLGSLDRSRFDPWVVELGQAGSVADAIRNQGIEVHKCGLRSVYSFRFLQTIFRLSTRIRRTNTRIVQSYLFADNLVGAIAGRLGGARAVITGRRTVDEWESPRHRWLYRRTNRLVDRIVVVSSDVEASVLLHEKVKPGMVRLIENRQSRELLLARSDPSEAPLLDELDRSTEGQFIFGTVGNIRPVKGHDVLIHAFHRLVQEHPNTYLVIVGGYSQGAPPLDGMIQRLGLVGKVHLAGYRANVAEYLQLFSAFVLPSLAEGMSNALLEALLIGKPCISTSFGLPKTSQGEDVVLPVPPGDVEALYEAMRRIRADDGLRTLLSNRALAFSREKMDVGKMVSEYEMLYEELLS